MNDFLFERAQSPEGAISAVRSRSGARFIAGGTNILDLMKDAVEAPSLLVDINALPLRGIEQRGSALFIGALERMGDVAAHPIVRERLPLVAIALKESASPQLRNMATVGGNVLQRTRCPYFRDVVTACNKRNPGSGCSAIGGENRRQAVLGTSDHCIAAHASDFAVALTALGATIHVIGPDGAREIAFREFYRFPGSTPEVETALERGELIAGLSLPLLPFAGSSTYVKVRDRAQFDFALVSAAVALHVEDTVVREARIALGGVGTIPWHAPEAERALVGGVARREDFQKAAGLAMSGARGYGGNDFKIVLAQRALVRALEIATPAA